MKSLKVAAVLLPAIVVLAACAGPDSASGGVAAGRYESGARTTQATNQTTSENRNRMLVDYARGY
jgi:hypothetical protein